MTPYIGYTVLVSVLLISAYLLWAESPPTSSLPVPPGPPQLPIIGNLHQAPKSYAWRQYYQWSQKYGSIIHLNMAGQSVVVLSITKVAHDLLAKQGATFSDRPRFVVGTYLIALTDFRLIIPRWPGSWPYKACTCSCDLTTRASNCTKS